MLALCNPRSGAKQLHRAGKFNRSLFGNVLTILSITKPVFIALRLGRQGVGNEGNVFCFDS